jgi:hypothetical protein
VDCTTPYPAILRHCIKQVISHVRKDFPKDYVRVTVDSANMALKVARWSSDGWYTFDDPIKLPPEVLDINARFAPENVVVRNLPVKRTEPAVPDEPVVMEGDDTQEKE